jgi:hypothetical protein
MWMNGRAGPLAAGLSVGRILGWRRLADRTPTATDTLPGYGPAEVLSGSRRITSTKSMSTSPRGAVRMIAQLDPHSAFPDSDEYREIRISTTGNYSGVGPKNWSTSIRSSLPSMTRRSARGHQAGRRDVATTASRSASD